jgi:hydroxyacylglutathione hydrolase
MYFKQYYLGCLAHASYLIGSEGEAAVIDPQRDVDQYLAEAKQQGLQVGHIIETHLHADFVSGHIELAEKTGAKIYFGHRSGAKFDHTPVHDGDQIKLGDISLQFLETPGHTPESISVLVVEHGKPNKILTGDTLFIGDVGRPDLVGSKGFSAPEMAGFLYDSLHQKLLSLPDEVEVWPAHGAGSACGKNISKETSSTIGQQRKMNYALQPMTKDAFVKMMTNDLPPPPKYFPFDAEMNRQGARALDALPTVPLLTQDQVTIEMNKGALVVDIRDGASFGSGHLAGAINIGLEGQFAPWAGVFIDSTRPVILEAADAAMAQEARMRLARVGLENVIGYFEKPVDAVTIPQIDVDELHRWMEEKKDVQVVDVRRPGEFSSGHVPGAINIPLDEFAKSDFHFKSDRPVAVICAGGYRSSLASGIFQSTGVQKLFNVVGGTSAWKEAGFPLQD